MTDYNQSHTTEWLEYFGRQGYPDVRPLASGVEGAIYRLKGGTVAKVWGHRGASALVKMQKFYADVAHANLGFATPVILSVDEVDGTAITYERELYGQPLQDRLAFDDAELDESSVKGVIDVLKALATVPATEAMLQMPVLDEDHPFRDESGDFPASLIALLDRRVQRFGNVLRSHVVDFDQRYARIVEKLAGIDRVQPSVVHGDLFGANILVDESARPVSVLDFGFLSTAGDPRLDASITAGIMNMYGPHAEEIATTLTDRLAMELGYSPEVLLVYRAAYAVATSNVFTADGSDGHFLWCVAQLTQQRVTTAIGL
jgi:aminoglycoside phosphotransferase (APT) family kinase protein